MNVTKYEIDILDVEAADAILIHFYDDNDQDYIVCIDAGNYSDGKKISDFIKTQYSRFKIDLAIVTHCDADHYGGFAWLLEDMRANPCTSVDIKKFWINDPGNHVDKDDYRYRTSQRSVIREAQEVFTLPSTSKNLIEMIDRSGIDRAEAFSWGVGECFAFGKTIEVIGPTEKYYASLVPNFRNELIPYDDDSEYDDDSHPQYDSSISLSYALDNSEDDASSHNQSSIIILFRPNDGRKFLFCGDAGVADFENLDTSDIEKIKSSYMLKVPHHGSKHNLNSIWIRHFNPYNAYISTQKYGRFLSKAVVNSLNKIHCNVYSTHGPNKGNMQIHHNLPLHKGYVPLKPLK